MDAVIGSISALNLTASSGVSTPPRQNGRMAASASLTVKSRAVAGTSKIFKSQFSGAPLHWQLQTQQNFSRVVSAKAEKSSSSGNSKSEKLAPLEPESPTGQFLTQLLQSHPHLFSAAAEQQLEKLVAEKEEQDAKESDLMNANGNDLVLYKRIADVRTAERRRAIEEVIYALIVQRFVKAGASLMPQIPFLSTKDLSPKELMAAFRPSKDKELLQIHSEDVREMAKEHLDMILKGVRPEGFSPMLDDRILLVAFKLKLGQVYAASIMYGYFLRRIDQRFQLEKTMKSLQAEGGIWEAFGTDSGSSEANSKSSEDNTGISDIGRPPLDPMDRPGENELAAAFSAAAAAMAIGGAGGKQSPLRQYIAKFDQETLIKNATMRSSEGLSVIEKHTEALFGRPEVVMSEDGGLAMLRDDAARLSISTLRRMVLEAVAFGSFLWDIESYVDSQYAISKS